MPPADSSLLLPTFLRRLADPDVKTVMLCGCGGGFDFVHSLLLYPELQRLGKSVVIGSYSFGNPNRISGDAETVFDSGGVVAKRVTAASRPDPYYGPEVHVCSYLDSAYPGSAPHSLYAYYARAFSVPLLRRLYEQLILAHAVDAVVIVDGGSDSLMAGDEEGLGDPIEDAVSVATVASLDPRLVKILVSVGLGTDRYNHVSDAASLRAIAELTRLGGFLGAVSLEPSSPCCRFYRDCLEHIYRAPGVPLGPLGDDRLGHRGLVRPGRGPPAGRGPGESRGVVPLAADGRPLGVRRRLRRPEVAHRQVDRRLSDASPSAPTRSWRPETASAPRSGTSRTSRVMRT